jgi:hypothetical protein
MLYYTFPPQGANGGGTTTTSRTKKDRAKEEKEKEEEEEEAVNKGNMQIENLPPAESSAGAGKKRIWSRLSRSSLGSSASAPASSPAFVPPAEEKKTAAVETPQTSPASAPYAAWEESTCRSVFERLPPVSQSPGISFRHILATAYLVNFNWKSKQYLEKEENDLKSKESMLHQKRALNEKARRKLQELERCIEELIQSEKLQTGFSLVEYVLGELWHGCIPQIIESYVAPHMWSGDYGPLPATSFA